MLNGFSSSLTELPFPLNFFPSKSRIPYHLDFLEMKQRVGWIQLTCPNQEISAYHVGTSFNVVVQGTTFVLQKETEERQRLLSVISKGQEVREAIDKFVTANQSTSEGEFELLEGEWLMIWNSQEVTESWIENASKGLMGKQIIKTNGQMKFLVDIVFGLKFSMTGTYVKSGYNTYGVVMDDAAILAGPYGIPAEMETKFTLELLYADEKIRISRDQKDIIFVHIRIGKAV